MKISMKFDRPLFGPAGGTRYLWVRVEAPFAERTSTRAPLDISLVLDRSGSMGGRKMALTQRAARSAVSLLRETDRCALVEYDNIVTMAVPAAGVDDAQRRRIIDAIDQLFARANTNLFGGWLAGAEAISDAPGGRVKRVMLLTDGLANEGLTDHQQILHHVRELAVRGVATTTFGVGADFDEHLVAGMAEAGGGHFYYVERPEQIPDFLHSELGELLTVVARQVKLSIVTAGPAQVYNLNDLPLDNGAFRLGDMSEGEVVDLCFAIEIAPEFAGPLGVAAVLEWVGAVSDAPASTRAATDLALATDQQVASAPAEKAVIAEVVKVASASAREDALRSNYAGDYEAARSRMNRAIDLVTMLKRDYPEAAAEVAVLRDQARTFSMRMNPLAAKSEKMAAYESRRSRIQQKR
jgi:Ca-activated chloride channel family protein